MPECYAGIHPAGGQPLVLHNLKRLKFCVAANKHITG